MSIYSVTLEVFSYLKLLWVYTHTFVYVYLFPNIWDQMIINPLIFHLGAWSVFNNMQTHKILFSNVRYNW